GDVRGAWKQMQGLQPGPSDAWRGDFVILKAKMLEDASAFAETTTWLTQSANDLSGDAEYAPLYYFLLGLGYRGAGQGDNARQAFSAVVRIAGDTDIGKSAAALLQSP
ncbi:MAG TPA: hypothetical protein VL359_08275, partial [bacterium]|nr:hypothetical protein [bacterium]